MGNNFDGRALLMEIVLNPDAKYYRIPHEQFAKAKEAIDEEIGRLEKQIERLRRGRKHLQYV